MTGSFERATPELKFSHATTPKSTIARALMQQDTDIGDTHSSIDRQAIRTVVERLWFLFVVIALSVIMFAITMPVLQYVMLTFFASYHGGADCMEAPTSQACRLAAGDLTTYKSIVGGLTSLVSTVTALTLGSLSDSIGRRFIFVVKGFLSVAMIYALAFYQWFGLSLWVFLIITPLMSMWDFNGVTMALMADVIPEKGLRGSAMSITIALVLTLVLICIGLSAVLPVDVSFTVALISGAIKLVFYLTCFPETVSGVATADTEHRQGPVGALRAAYRTITKNSFILRMACIAVIGGVAFIGTSLTTQPYITAYIGMQRQQMSILFVAMIVSVLVTLGLVAKPLIAYLGEVRTYQLCLLSVALAPVSLCFCTTPLHVILMAAVFSGPNTLQFPIISAIKSNLVGDSEQGLIQGALASLVNFASAIAAPLFGWLYNLNTEGGASESRSAAFPSLITAAGVGMIALLVSLSLPLKVPPPEPPALHDALLRDAVADVDTLQDGII